MTAPTKGLIVKRHWLYAAQLGDLLFVYRSPLVKDDDTMYRPVKAMIAGHQLDHREQVEDPDMMFGKAQLSIYKKV